jgi:hypothetical protein
MSHSTNPCKSSMMMAATVIVSGFLCGGSTGTKRSLARRRGVEIEDVVS